MKIKVTNQELLTRIEQLENQTKEILKYCSCIGEAKEAELDSKVCR
jgi:predicted ATPase